MLRDEATCGLAGAIVGAIAAIVASVAFTTAILMAGGVPGVGATAFGGWLGAVGVFGGRAVGREWHRRQTRSE